MGSEESANLRARLAEASDRKIVVSIASYAEQMRGWMALLAKTPDVRKQVDAVHLMTPTGRGSQRQLRWVYKTE